ncbi:MAG: hypothetical protein IJ512_03035, partial [Ruminococcus sp.]|nr:hypothetical protein [Ruminococcus sp.]
SENCGYIQNHFGGDGFFEITEDDALVYISIDRRDPKKEIRTVICEEEKGTRNEYLLIDSEYYILISDEEMYMCRIGSEERVPLSLE